MDGLQLRHMREREEVSRYYVSHYTGLSMYEISRIESGITEVDDTVVQQYTEAIDNVRRNSLPAYGVRLIWSAPGMTEKAV